MEEAKTISISLLKKGLSKQEALAVLDEAKTLIEVGINFEQCKHCGANIYEDDAIYCTQCGKKLED